MENKPDWLEKDSDWIEEQVRQLFNHPIKAIAFIWRGAMYKITENGELQIGPGGSEEDVIDLLEQLQRVGGADADSKG